MALIGIEDWNGGYDTAGGFGIGLSGLEVVHQDACACIFEPGFLACPDAGEVFLWVARVVDDFLFFVAEGALQQGVAEFAAAFDIDADLTVAYSHSYGFVAVTDVEVYAFVVGDIRFAVFAECP